MTGVPHRRTKHRRIGDSVGMLVSKRGGQGLLWGTADRSIGHALVLKWERFSGAWSLASPTQASALSRTVCDLRAAFFAVLVGQSPMAYLTSVWVHAAAWTLRLGASVAQAAEATGYSSEAAFRMGFVVPRDTAALRQGDQSRCTSAALRARPSICAANIKSKHSFIAQMSTGVNASTSAQLA